MGDGLEGEFGETAKDVGTGAAAGSLLGPIGTVVGAAGGLAEGIWNDINQSGASAQNQANFNTQLQLDDTAIQRRVADLKAAGLAPQLAVGGASTPSAPVDTAARVSGLEDPGNAMVNLEKQQQQQDEFEARMLSAKADVSNTYSQMAYRQHQSDMADQKESDSQDAMSFKQVMDRARLNIDQDKAESQRIASEGMGERGEAALQQAATQAAIAEYTKRYMSAGEGELEARAHAERIASQIATPAAKSAMSADSVADYIEQNWGIPRWMQDAAKNAMGGIVGVFKSGLTKLLGE